MAEDRAFIEFYPDGMIKYRFYARVRKEGTMSIWYIPAYDIYFSSPDHEIGKRRAESAVKSFYNYHLHKQGLRNFVLQIHKLGFKAPKNHEFTMKQLLTGRLSEAKFKSRDGVIPEEFANAEEVNQEGQMQIA